MIDQLTCHDLVFQDTGDGGQKLATRVMVAMEMSILNLNGLFEFKECPTQNEVSSNRAIYPAKNPNLSGFEPMTLAEWIIF